MYFLYKYKKKDKFKDNKFIIMNKLPIEIVEMIFNNLNNFLDMYSLKLVCKDYNLYIHKFSLIKIKLQEKIIFIKKSYNNVLIQIVIVKQRTLCKLLQRICRKL